MKLLPFGMLGAALLAAGCVSVPTGPSHMALPGTGKPFEQFRADDGYCRQYAYDAVGGHTAGQAQVESGVASTLAGAAIGALIGGAAGGGHGAAVGAGIGGGAGALVGVSAADASGYGAQQRYDQAYTQCMYGKGHRVAVYGRQRYQAAASGYYPPPPPAQTTYSPPPGTPVAGSFPPPPPGSPPPNPAWIVR
ncbi:MAG TPA: hypothetical protein VHP37_28330 [Burkholderiales bacterium]|nr:hypothetical protein [Burkholderiales bacterium]